MNKNSTKVILLLSIVLILGLFFWGIRLVFVKKSSSQASLKIEKKMENLLEAYGESLYQACKEVYIYDFFGEKPIVHCSYAPSLLERKKGLILPKMLQTGYDNYLQKDSFNILILDLGRFTLLDKNFQNDQVLCIEVDPSPLGLKSYPIYSVSLNNKEKYPGVWFQEDINKGKKKLICTSSVNKGEVLHLGLIFYPYKKQGEYNLRVLKFPAAYSKDQVLSNKERAQSLFEANFKLQ